MMLRRRWSMVILAVGLIAALASEMALAQTQPYSLRYGQDHHFNPKKFRVSETSTLVTVVGKPAMFDPRSEVLAFNCRVGAKKSAIDGSEPVAVRNAKGFYRSELWILDLDRGTLERREIGAGRFKTGDYGSLFEYDIDPTLFTNATMLALIQTKSDFTNKKKANFVSLSCQFHTFPKN